MSEVRRKDAERKLLTLAILDGTIDRPTAADLVRCIDKLECRIDALERRIEAVEWLTDIVKAHSKLFDAILRKLNHKGGDE